MTLDEYLNKCLKDEGFRKAWEEEMKELVEEYGPEIASYIESRLEAVREKEK